MSDLQAVILAGGKGTRLRPITSELPKPLVPVANRPLIIHQMRHLVAHGVSDLTLALGYSAEQFDPIREEGERLGLSVNLITEPERLETGGALRYCYDQGAFDPDRPLFWMNGDVVANPDPRALVDFHRERESAVTLWLTAVRAVSEFGVLEIDDEGFVRSFLEKPEPDETESNFVNAGILVLDPHVLERIPSETFFSFEDELLPDMVVDDEPVFGKFDGGYWLDTGRPDDYLAANRHVLEGRLGWEPRGEREGNARVWRGEGVEADEVGIIQPAVLGDGVRIEPTAQLFGRTVLGDGCRVSAGAELDGSVLFADAEIGEDAQVIDSVVCTGAVIGSGTVVSNAVVGAGARIGPRNELRGLRLWGGIELGERELVCDQ